MSRNALTPSPGPSKASQWTTHLRQPSKVGLDRSAELAAHSPDTVSSQSTIQGLPPAKRVYLERKCTVTVNESFARDEVLLNLDLLGADAHPGSLMAIELLRPETDKLSQAGIGKQPTSERTRDVGNGQAAELQRRYYFVVKDLSKELKNRYPNVEVYVAKHIADAFGMRRGSQVLLSLVDSNNPAIEASHVELVFKDQYLSRSDMWRMTVMELSQRTVYRGQMVLFLGTVKAQVSTVFVDGRKVQSAYFGRNTRPIFRSDSARYVLFIQMAREMWDFDSDGSGEIMFNKVVNGFLPALFKKWVELKVKHLVSIVLFARVEYDTGLATELANSKVQNNYYTGIQSSGDKRPYKDFYRVVVSEMASGEWTRILYQLRREFNYFRQDISVHHLRAMTSVGSMDDNSNLGSESNRIKAESSRAIYGNVLEAINMASTVFAHDYIDRDLMRTGISVVMITPSPGVFEVEYDSLRSITEDLVNNGIGIDLICVQKIPLHSVPLFRYRNPQYLDNSRTNQKLIFSYGSTPTQMTPAVGSYSSFAGSLSPSPSKGIGGTLRSEFTNASVITEEWCYALPQWLHVSYWNGTSEEALSYQGIALSVSDTSQKQCNGDFPVRCRMYDLQMRSVLETNEIETKPLYLDSNFPAKAINAGYSMSAARQTISQSGLLNTKVPETIFDHVYGFQKFIPERSSKSGVKSIWKLLQEYDDSKAHLPTRRITSYTRLGGREAHEGTKRPLKDEPSLLGTSMTEKLTPLSNRSIPSSVPSAQKVLMEKVGSTPRTSKESDFANHLSPTKPPKFMRAISLGQRGFGIAAPKAATAELSTETVNASRSNTPAASSASTRRPPPTSQHTSTYARNPSPSIEFTPDQSHKNESVAIPETTAKPIGIRTAPQFGNAPIASGSILSSTLRAEPPLDDRDVKYSNAFREDDEGRIQHYSKLIAQGEPDFPRALSPKSTLAPWMTVLNPSNPDPHRVDMTTLYSRWQHVFPRPSEMRAMKWKSLCSPAAVPLTTEYFPTKAEFDSEYQRQPYNVSQNADDELSEEPKSRDELLRELVSLRFSQGFQVVIGPAVAKAFGQKLLKFADIFSRDNTVEDGTSVFMSVGNTIHQLSCVTGTEVEINIFARKSTDVARPILAPGKVYKPAIRTLLDHEYQTNDFDAVPPRIERNWNYIDSYIAGHNEELNESLRFWRARFVLIPIVARTAAHPGMQHADFEEEIRLEGIRKLAQLWLKYRYVPPVDRRFQNVGIRGKKVQNPLDIVYRTEDPSIIIAQELETLPLLETSEGYTRKGQLVTSRDQFQKKNFSMAALAEAIQQPVENGGVRMQNRRWHLRLHYNCFIGSDMTSWLLDNFEDLEDREEAEGLGKRLMIADDDKSREKDKEAAKEGKREGGLFVHVEKRHPFRDGQYFYQISGEYAKPHPPGWFNSKRRDATVPSTPISEYARDASRTGLSRPVSGPDDNSPIAGATTLPAQVISGKKPRVVLSRVMKYDVDHRKRSYRTEAVDLHYDRLHNPDNCYHIRIEWMNVTAKLIEDAIESWAREATQHGMRLVEVPIAEACAISEINPFRRPYLIRLALPPPTQQPITYFDPSSFAPLAQPGRHFYQKAILKKFDFVLDMEAASNYPSNVEVSYSWGKPNFKYTQYIHRSGVVIAEITDDGDILVLANRLCSNRAAAVREREIRYDMDRGGLPHPGSGASGAGARPTPAQTGSYAPYGISDPTPIPSPSIRPAVVASPMARPAPTGPFAAATTRTRAALGDPEAIKDELEAFCLDGPALEAFYRELLERQPPPQSAVTPGTMATGGHAVPDVNIPVLGLPPGVLAATGAATGPGGRGGSPVVGLPASAAHLLRRGSVQDGILGLRLGGGGGGAGGEARDNRPQG